MKSACFDVIRNTSRRATRTKPRGVRSLPSARMEKHNSGSVSFSLLVVFFLAFSPGQQEAVGLAVLVRVSANNVTFRVDAKWQSIPGIGDVNWGELPLVILKTARDVCRRIHVESNRFATRVQVPDTSC